MAKYKVLRKCYGSESEPKRLFKEGEIIEMNPEKVSKHFKLIEKGEKAESKSSGEDSIEASQEAARAFTGKKKPKGKPKGKSKGK